MHVTLHRKRFAGHPEGSMTAVRSGLVSDFRLCARICPLRGNLIRVPARGQGPF